MNFGLSDGNFSRINSIFRKFPEIESVLIYGSRAKGNYKNNSDIDLSLVGETINLQLLNKIELELDDLLLPYTFDLSILHQISNLDLLDHIKRAGKIFYKRQT